MEREGGLDEFTSAADLHFNEQLLLKKSWKSRNQCGNSTSYGSLERVSCSQRPYLGSKDSFQKERRQLPHHSNIAEGSRTAIPTFVHHKPRLIQVRWMFYFKRIRSAEGVFRGMVATGEILSAR
jgi:hypothetical protein